MSEMKDNLEAWMYKNQKTAMSILIALLIIIGLVIGVAVATNVYNDGMTQIFEEGTTKNLPVNFNGKMYYIQDMNISYDDYVAGPNITLPQGMPLPNGRS